MYTVLELSVRMLDLTPVIPRCGDGKLKLSWIISGAAVAAFVAVVAPWVIVYFSLELSSSPGDWAAFGGYVGGTLSPIVATLALIAFLKTLSQQQKQIETLNSQSAKSDLLSVIDKIENDFERCLSTPVVVELNGKRFEYLGLDVVTRVVFPGWEQAIVNQDDIERLVAEHGALSKDDQNLYALEMFSAAAGNLNQLRLYVEKHDELSGNNALTKYYQRKYKLAYERFVARSLLKERWVVKDAP